MATAISGEHMAWEKIVQRVGIGACPECGNPGFDYQQGGDPDDHQRAAIICPKCGWKGIIRDLVIIPKAKPK